MSEQQAYGREVALQNDAVLQFAGSAWSSFVRTLLQVSSENRSLSADPRLALTQLLSSDLWALEEGNNLLLVTRYFVLPCTLKENNSSCCLQVHSCRPTADGDAVNAFREGALVKANWVVFMPEEKACGGRGAAELYQRFFPGQGALESSAMPRIETPIPAPEPEAVNLKVSAPVKSDPMPWPAIPAESQTPKESQPAAAQIPPPAPAVPPIKEAAAEAAVQPVAPPILKPALEQYVPPVPAETPAVAETIGTAPEAEIETLPPFKADSSFEAGSAPSGDSGLVSFKVSGGYTLEGALPQDAVDQILKKAPGFQPKVVPDLAAAPEPVPELLSNRPVMASVPPSTAGRMGSFTESTGSVSLSQGSIDALLSRMQVPEAQPSVGSRISAQPEAVPELVAAAPRRISAAMPVERPIGPPAERPPLPVAAAGMAGPKAAHSSDEVPEQMTQAQIDALLKQISEK